MNRIRSGDQGKANDRSAQRRDRDWTANGRRKRRPLNAGRGQGGRTGGPQQAGRSDAGPKADGGQGALELEQAQDRLDARCGFRDFTDGGSKLGWLINFNACTVENKETGTLGSAVACYFICQSGDMFKCKLPFEPYFYLQVRNEREHEVEAYLRRKFEGLIKTTSVVDREDLDLKNHLAGWQRRLLKVGFPNVQALMEVKAEILPVVQRNAKQSQQTNDAYALLATLEANKKQERSWVDALSAVEDVREYDVPYHVRFAIDEDVRAGCWYAISASEGHVSLKRRHDLIFRGEPRVCAFDIETTKLPLHFPNAEHDQVFMISYMVDRQGYLIVNRKVVGADVSAFEYTPKPEFAGPFEVFNEPDERHLLTRWFKHMAELKPAVYVTYNGDFFDWPFIEARAQHHGLRMRDETGFGITKSGECLAKGAVHMDCLCWVNRDSYLPQGSRGLKAVTKAKLGYDPVEVDPEDMVPLAQSRPQAMASYSVSDAVATYYLYMTYIHPFIFSLATIIPMPPDDVLRKGSGTLCEQLLMVEAFRSNVVCPNKHLDSSAKFYKGRLLQSETYIGGKVEALASGIFRSNLPCEFELQPAGFQGLLDRLDNDLRYGLEVECKAKVGDIENFEEVKQEIARALEALRDDPNRTEEPVIYHLDVAAMYPNIILTNRLQPSAIVSDADCAACDFNHPGKQCLRNMEWVWRGEPYMINQAEYQLLRNQLEVEKFPPAEPDGPVRLGKDLPPEEHKEVLTARIKTYAQRVYKRVTNKPATEEKVAGVCQRENAFYIDTVRAFRDRRYEYKGLVKKWKRTLGERSESGDRAGEVEAKDMVVLFDSLQLAHKCILNSFYGYVMRKGARWFSMEMAGVTTYTGAKIIQRACELVEKVGKPLELDTDGIWCCLPRSFPEDYTFVAKDGKKHRVSYPGLMLNVMCVMHNTNDQYHQVVKQEDGALSHEVQSHMSIEFEIDGPYLAMVLPASKEEGKLIKKRYAVFNHDGSLAELKGFEIKRRGELKLIKAFQSEVFEHFLSGSTLKECYAAVAAVANHWLDLIDTRGIELKDSELIEYFSESCMMSKGMEEYGDRKSCAITTAKRLGQFLGNEQVKEKGLACNYIVARAPVDTPTSSRAIPVIIFQADAPTARMFLRRWTGEVATGEAHEAPDVREFLDWNYYRERLGSAIQKIITVPAAYQNVPNPVPRVKHPDWLHKQVRRTLDTHKQQSLKSMLGKMQLAAPAVTGQPAAKDIEDIEDGPVPALRVATGTGAPAHKRARVFKITAQTDSSNGAGDTAADENCMGLANASKQAAGAGSAVAEGPPTGHVGSEAKGREGYSAWVRRSKVAWRARRAAVAQRQQTGVQAAGAAAGAGGGLLAGAVMQQAAASLHATWHVVKIEPDSKPGHFVVWAVVDLAMYRFALRTPRTLFIQEDPSSQKRIPGGTRMERVLPNGSSALLLEMELDESEFLETAETMRQMLLSPCVAACHETRLPLELQALVTLGAVCRSSMRDAAVPPPTWDLSSLAFHAAAAPQYLAGDVPGGVGALRWLALHVDVQTGGPGFRAAGAQRKRGALALLLPAVAKVEVVVLMSDRLAERELHGVLAEDLWLEVVRARSGRGECEIEGLEEFAVAVEYATGWQDACAAVARKLTDFRRRVTGPLVALLQAPPDLQADLPHHISPLRAVPTCQLAFDVSEPGGPSREDPSAGVFERDTWQSDAVRAGLSQCLAARPLLAQRMEVARFCGVPVCNLGAQPHVAAADVAFARALRAANHLLWAEDAALPDVVPGHHRHDAALDIAPDPIELDPGGCHRCVCVELRVHHLLLNAVLQSAELAALEGSVLEDCRWGRTLKVLRGVLNGWIDEATLRRNKVADDLLQRTHGWLANRRSRCHSPQLSALAATLTSKAFLQLLADLARLDATLVAARPDSIILATRKPTLPAAAAYVSFLLRTLREHKLFGWLGLEPVRVWHALLWRDPFNYSGIRAPHALHLFRGTDGREGEGHPGEGAADADGEAVYEARWNIRDFLPAAMHKYFDDVVEKFVVRPWQAVVQGEGSEVQAAGTAALRPGKMEEAYGAFLRSWLPSTLLGRLFQMTEAVVKNVLPGAAAPEARFPRPPGSHLAEEELPTPALAFVRTVCHVLDMDVAVQDEVTGVRRQLLAVLHMREFASDAKFVDPCKPVVLRSLECLSCCHLCDLDVTRVAATDGALAPWRCPACAAPFDALRIERLLLEQLQAAVAAYQTQDLVCVRCSAVAMNALAPQCDLCGSAVQLSVPGPQLRRLARALNSVAAAHGLELLEDASARALSM